MKRGFPATRCVAFFSAMKRILAVRDIHCSGKKKQRILQPHDAAHYWDYRNSKKHSLHILTVGNALGAMRTRVRDLPTSTHNVARATLATVVVLHTLNDEV